MVSLNKKMFFLIVFSGAVIGILSLWNIRFAISFITLGLVLAFIFVSGRNLSLIALGITIISIILGRIAVISFFGRSPDLLYVDVFAAFAIYIWFGEQAIKGKHLKLDILIPAMIYALVSIGTTLFHSNDLLREWSLLKTMIMGLALYFMAYNSVETLEDSSRLFGILVILGVLISGATIINIAMAGQNLWQLIAIDKNIVKLNFGKNNYIAAFLVILIPIAISQIRKHGSFSRNVSLVFSFIFMFVVLVLTRSRGAILSLVIGLLVGGGFILPKKTYIKVIGLMMLAGIAVSLVLPGDILFAIFDRFINLMDSGNRERFNMWLVSWRGFLQHPIFGLGIGGTSYLIRNSLGIPSLTSPHNYVFEFLAEVGIIGTISVLYIFATIIRNAWVVSKMSADVEIRSKYRFVLLGVISTLINGLVEPLHRAPQYVVVFWVLAGIIGASKRIVVSGNQSDHGV